MKEKDISLIIGQILRWGVYLALFVALLGGVIYLSSEEDHSSVQYGTFKEEDRNLLVLIKDTFRGVIHGDGRSIIVLGILLLIATPLARVVFSLWAFKSEGDRMYVMITLIVLLIIFISILTGFGG